MLGLSLPGWSGANVVTFRATAYSLNTGEPIYQEVHSEERQGDRPVRGRVEYRNPGGETFAWKEISYEPSLVAPSFEMTDLRTDFKEGARRVAGSIELYGGTEGDLDRRALPVPEDPVVDAGFHRFIQLNLDRLLQGETVAFDFAVPVEGRFFRFQLQKVEELQYSGEKAVRLRMKIGNPLLRLLLDPVELIYGVDGRLWEFIGLANIYDDRGERHLARIVFDYTAPEEDPVAPRLASTADGAEQAASAR